MQPMHVFWIKMWLSGIVDFADLTTGMTPLAGHAKEFAVIPFAVLLWGWRGFGYALEMVDVTNVVDGFVPTACIIGWTKKAEYERRQAEWEAKNRPPSPPTLTPSVQ